MYEEVASFPILDSVRATLGKCEFLAALCADELFVPLNILRVFNYFDFKKYIFNTFLRLIHEILLARFVCKQFAPVSTVSVSEYSQSK